MIFNSYRAAWAVFKQKPLRLWGLSLMYVLLATLATMLGILPIISIPITLTLSVGMIAIFMAGLRGEEVSSEQLFQGFKDFKRVCGGMAWMSLWVLLWSLIPIAGIVLGIIKVYQYRFVPYILLTRPDISATQALRVSMEETRGHRGKLFGADILFFGIIVGISLIFGLLATIPYAGVVFAIVGGLITMVISAFSPLFVGLYQAKLYEDVQVARTFRAPTCPNCGREYSEGSVYCPGCGQKLS